MRSRSLGRWQHAGLSQQLVAYTCVQKNSGQEIGPGSAQGLAWGTQIEHATKEGADVERRENNRESVCESASRTGRKNEAQREVKT